MNFVRPSAEFIAACRQLCTQHGALLIVDEVMTGFRVALGGAQAVLGVQPDISVFGKVIGGGMPLAAFGASRAIMSQLAPLGGVYQAGTLSGNPVATACGLATLDVISQPGFYDDLAAKTQQLTTGLQAAADHAGLPFCTDSQGGMFGFFFLPQLPQNYTQVMKTDGALFNRFYHGMLDRCVYFAPALYEAGFVSAAHTQADINATIAAAAEVMAGL
jgi:glutamate-1-semialdehyde 2,1-aminomutase